MLAAMKIRICAAACESLKRSTEARSFAASMLQAAASASSVSALRKNFSSNQVGIRMFRLLLSVPRSQRSPRDSS